MSNRQLSKGESEKANELLDEIRGQLRKLADDDEELLFAYRRKVYKELTFDERGKPVHRRRLKQLKRKEQEGLCTICGESLPEKNTVLDRYKAMEGYTEDNTRLIHQDCDTESQRSRNYA
jgi:hypothetical protein